MEVWDAYYKDGTKSGYVIEREKLNIPDGLYYMVCEVLVRHIDGEYLLMRRDLRKANWAGYWEASAGGAVLKGETPLEGAKRELFEETGILSDNLRLFNQSSSDMDKALFYDYLCVVDIDKKKILLQEGETIDFKWVGKEELLRILHEDVIIPNLKERLLKNDFIFNEE